MRALCVLLLAAGPGSGALAGASAHPLDRSALDERAAPDERLDERLEALASADVEVWRAAFEALTDAGEAAARRALATFHAAGVAGRRSRARLVLEAGGPTCIEPALALARDDDPEVRRLLARFLGSFALGASRSEERARFLAELARDDPRREVRREAIRALARSGMPEAPAALFDLLLRLPGPEQGPVADALARSSAARPLVVQRVQALFEALGAGAPRNVDETSLARLLRAYGPALADVPEGGAAAPERAPILIGRRHPSPGVRGAAAASLDRMLDRLVELGENERADAVLAALADDGADRRELLYRRAYLALSQRAAVGDAGRRAAELVAAAAGDTDADGRTWRFFGLHLGAVALFAAGDAAGARAEFARAQDLLRTLAWEREDLRPDLAGRRSYPIAPLGGAVMVDRLQQLALGELWQALCLLEERGRLDDLEMLRHAREAHAFLLEAQLFGLERDADFPASHTFDDVLDRELAPRRLLLSNRELGGWKAGTGVDLQLLLARAIATVAPAEMPGFEPAQADLPRELTDWSVDERRFQLLQRIQRADLASARRAWLAERAKLFERAHRESDPSLVARGVLLRHQAHLRLLDVQRRVNQQAEELGEAEAGALRDPLRRGEHFAGLAEYRSPSQHALTLAAELRADGRAAEARDLSARMLAAVRGGLPGTTNIGLELVSARLELSISSSYTDEDRPREAEREALKAVERLEAFENTLEERLAEDENDPTQAARWRLNLQQIRRMRAGALLSLAVNANVRLNDQERALGYFEEAYELDQRDFMRGLLACYRARSGKDEEARAVLRTLQPAPPLYYNLACTHALLGDADTALDFLRREFAENHPAEGSRRRQAEWAREDPDLESLRGDPRFERLVGTD